MLRQHKVFLGDAVLLGKSRQHVLGVLTGEGVAVVKLAELRGESVNFRVGFHWFLRL